MEKRDYRAIVNSQYLVQLVIYCCLTFNFAMTVF